MPTAETERDPRIVSLPASEIRRRFVEFFAERGHAIVPSASLVPAGDKAAAAPADTGSPGLTEAREVLGEQQVLVCGKDAVDDRLLVSLLAERGWNRILSEGGPHLASSMVAAAVLDEVCLSLTPWVVGGGGPRMTTAAATRTGYVPHVLVEEDGTVMGRWFRSETR